MTTDDAPRLRGMLKADWWVDCGKCHNPTFVDTHANTLRAADVAKAMGFRHTKKYGWVCPECLKKDGK